MGKINRLILMVVLGVFVAVNSIAGMITFDPRVLVPLNLVAGLACFGVFRFIDAHVSGLSKDLGISREAARVLIGDYFAYYKNVEKISIDEYLKRSSI